MKTCTYTMDWDLIPYDEGQFNMRAVPCGEEARWKAGSNFLCDDHREVVLYNDYPYKLTLIEVTT